MGGGCGSSFALHRQYSCLDVPYICVMSFYLHKLELCILFLTLQMICIYVTLMCVDQTRRRVVTESCQQQPVSAGSALSWRFESTQPSAKSHVVSPQTQCICSRATVHQARGLDHSSEISLVRRSGLRRTCPRAIVCVRPELERFNEGCHYIDLRCVCHYTDWVSEWDKLCTVCHRTQHTVHTLAWACARVLPVWEYSVSVHVRVHVYMVISFLSLLFYTFIPLVGCILYYCVFEFRTI